MLVHVGDADHVLVDIAANLEEAMAVVGGGADEAVGAHALVAFNAVSVHLALPQLLVSVAQAEELCA